MAEVEKRRCISCRGMRQIGEIRDMIYIEPESGESSEAVVLQGYICEECAVINWAWPSDADYKR